MIVRHNKFIKPTLKIPSKGSDKTIVRLVNNTLYVDNLETYVANFIDEKMDVTDDNKTYFAGFQGSYTNQIQIYKGEYRDPTNKQNLHYVRVTKIKQPIHIQSFSSADLMIKNVFMTEGEPDIVVPNKKDYAEDIQAYYPPEGDYKEIEPVRG